MTKAELIEKMAKDAGISKAAAKLALESLVGGVSKALKKPKGRVTLVGFGTFKKTYRKARTGRNPQTGAKIKIKGRSAVTFKASGALVGAAASGPKKKGGPQDPGPKYSPKKKI